MAMTDRLNSDIEALFGDPVPGLDPADSDRRARLAVDLAAALAVAPAPSAATASEPARVAAYVDHGLTDDEKEAYFGDLASSPAALAEVDAMMALLETVESAPLRAPDALLERARALLAGPAVPPPVPWWRFAWITAPHARLGFGLACAAILVIVIIPIARLAMQRGASPDVADAGRRVVADAPSDEASSLARGAPIDRDAKAGTVPLANGWAAIAVSPSTRAFGTAAGKHSQWDADQGALAKCAEQGAKDCAVRLSREAQCLALAAGPNGVPAAASDKQLPLARTKALEACSGAGVGPCAVIVSVCGG
jgi:hypothetical protein